MSIHYLLLILILVCKVLAISITNSLELDQSFIQQIMIEEEGVRKEYVKYDDEANIHKYICSINYQIMKGN